MSSERPWAARTAELWEQQGTWADYSAFIGWLDSRDPANQGIGDTTIADTLDGVQLAHLYAACCEIADREVQRA